MKPKILLCLALVLSGGFVSIASAIEFTNSPALTNSEQNFQSLVKLVEQRQFYPAHDFYWQQKGIFSQDQRNAIFLLAAKMLIITNDAKLHLDQVDESDLHFLGDLLLADYFTVQDGVTYRDYGITNSEGIPFLITALTDVTNEDPRLVDMDAKLIIQELKTLTRRDTGYINGNDHFFTKNYQAVTAWWQDWWRQNKNRHPVFDVDLEKILRSDVLKLNEKIMRVKPTPNFHWDSSARFELEHAGNFYTGNEWNGGPKNSVFMYEYGHMPGNIAMGGGYFPERGADVLYIHGEFVTEWLPENDEPIYETSISGKRFPMQEVFSETVEGTGIAIKVQIATTNTALVNVIREKLKE
jgi:hypothetical protein